VVVNLNIKKIRNLKNRFDGNFNENLNIDHGCCYFHNRKELAQFTDIDDNILDDIIDTIY